MQKLIMLSVMAFLGTLAQAAGIIHSPYAAFVANCNSQSFSNGPQTDENGGIWSYGYRGQVSGTNLTAFSAGKFKRASSELYGLDKQVDSSFIPYIVVNPGSTTVYDSGAVPNRESVGGVTPGDEFIVQPGYSYAAGSDNASKGVYGYPVIRFTVPRAGRYSVTAICETLSENVGDDGVTGFHLLVNGTVLEQLDVAHWRKGTTPVSYTFNHSDILLFAGDTIELLTSIGIKATRNALSYANDSSSVKIEIVEESEGKYSLGDDLVAAIAEGNGVAANPFGVWTVNRFSRRVADPYPDKKILTALKWAFMRDTHLWGFSRDGDLDLTQNPASNRSQNYFCVNTNSTPVFSIQMIAPAELFLMPFNDNVDVRFTTPEEGTWKITAKVRNLQGGHQDSQTCGIVVYGISGGRILFRQELATPNQIKNATLVGLTSELKKGAYIDLVVDNRGNSPNDPTGLKLFIEKVDGAERNFSNAGVSFAAEMAKGTSAANPFQDVDGVWWEAGWKSGERGKFTRLTYYSERVANYLRGWLLSESSALPRVTANYNHVLLDGVANVSSGGAVLYDDEFWMHPDNNRYSVLRYHAPSTGVYRVRASFRDINDGIPNQPIGVKCYVFANDCFAAMGTAAFTNNFYRAALLEPENLYLQEGESIDLGVGINRTANADATAVAATIEPGGEPLADFVNIDFMETRTDAYAGRGRIGWSNPLWNALVFGAREIASLERIRNAVGTRTTVSFSVSRTDGGTIAAWSDSGMNGLEDCGILSTGPSDVYAFTLGGLAPNAKYTLCLYTSNSGRFTVNGGAVRQTTMPWLWGGEVNDVAFIEATANAEGQIVGTFYSATAGVNVPFCGLQIGGTFEEAPATGLMIIIH